MMARDTGPLNPLEQQCLEPGHWLIEGWDVLRVYSRGYGVQWVALRSGEQFARRTLADIRARIEYLR
jgi:hypothetical protein